MPDLPNSLALTSIATDAEIISSDHRNNYSAIQTAVNGLIVALTGGTSGQVLTATDSDTVAYATLAGYLKAPQKYGTLIDIVSSTTETDILQAAGYQIPANTLGATGMARVTIFGDYLNNSGGDVNETIRMYFGGTKFLDSSVQPVTTSATRHTFRMQFEIANLGATNSQFLAGFGAMGSAVAATTGISAPIGVAAPKYFDIFGMSGTSSIDTTSSQTLRVTWQHATNAATVETRIRYSLIEFI